MPSLKRPVYLKERKMLISKNEKAVYPLFSVISSILIILSSLFLASYKGYYFILLILLFECTFGMGKYILKLLPGIIVSALIFFSVTLLCSGTLEYAISGGVRIAGVLLGAVPGLSLPPVNLTRMLNTWKAPRSLGLGMLITLRFFPLLGIEMKRIRDAMKTRGAGTSISMLYRSVILPFCVRLVNISDLLTLSVETRGFSTDSDSTVWKEIHVTLRDIVYLVLQIAICTISFIVLRGGLI